MKFKQITCGEYTYTKRVEYTDKEFIGHSIYGLDEEGQIWKWVCNDKNWRWVKLEDIKEDYAG